MALDVRKVCSGNFAEVWINGDLVGECKKVDAKIEISREEVKLPGSLITAHKITAIKGTGSLNLLKVSSRMIKLAGDSLKTGKDLRFEIIVNVKDPDSEVDEKVLLTNVAFSDLTLGSFEVGTVLETEVPFVFEDYKTL